VAKSSPPVATEPPPRLTHHRGLPRPLRSASRWLRVLGPGLITGAADDDPSGIGTYSQAGAAFGTGLVWLALYILPFVIAVQEMCGRIGLVTGRGLAGVIRQHYSRKLLFVVVALLFTANTINVGADLGAMAASVRMLAPGLPLFPLLVAFALFILALEIFVPYRIYARALKVLALSLLAYILTGIIIGPDWGAVLRATVIPTIIPTPAFLALVVAVIGTTISPYLFFWQASEEVEEVALKHRQQRTGDPRRQRLALLGQLRALRLDTGLGMLAANLTFFFIIVTTGSTLHANGIHNIQTADQAARALTPLVRSFPHAGTLAQILFAVGVVGTGLLAVPVLAGSAAYCSAEAFGWHASLGQTFTQARGFYGVLTLATLIGLAINLVGIDPIAALVFAAIINGLVAVPLLVVILRVANNKGIMGSYVNGRLANTLGGTTVVVMGIAGAATIITLFR
jgi:Mn2+/Fe2+ NRAMP family transporter